MARIVAPQMSTEERVYAFGTQALIEIFENMFLEDFQQEYECGWVDEAAAWISWEVIKRNQKADLIWFHAKGVDEALEMIGEVQQAINTGRIEPVLAGGVDVGRTRNTTELVALGQSTTGQLPLRFMVSLDRVEYDEQERVLGEVVTRLPFTQVLIDRNGIGNQLAENLERTGRVQGVNFTNQSKELWAVEARIQAERGNTPLPLERGLAYQIHSIKKLVTAAKNNVYDTTRNEKHHADQFWAWALAIWAWIGGRASRLEEGTLEVLEDYRG
jgi:phage FluMu gp28-like protein